MSKDVAFQLYGRKKYERPLTFIQTITVSNDILKQKALQQVGAEGWVELVAIPTTALIHVIGKNPHE